MISAQTRSAFVARENRFTLFRIMRECRRFEVPAPPAEHRLPAATSICMMA
jgi:hypothetical protein